MVLLLRIGSRVVSAGLTVRALQPVVSGLAALGYDPGALSASVGIERALLDNPEARVPHDAVMRLWQEAVADRGDPDIGLHVAEAAAIESFDVHAYAVFASATLREGLQLACRYQRLIHESTELSLTPGTGGAWLRHTLPGGFAVPRPSAEFLLTSYVRLGRIASGSEWEPLEVRFAHPAPQRDAEHRRLFGAALRFDSGENSVLVADEVLNTPCPQANVGLLDVLERHAGELLARSPKDSTLSAKVRAHLVSVLSGGAPSAVQVAAHFRMSVRTLARRLENEGTSYKHVLDQLRRERATALLRERRASIAEVAFLLGFADVSAFYRAFKRWTGTTPVDFTRS